MERSSLDLSLLPLELLRTVISFLDVKSFLALIQTCHYFHDLASSQAEGEVSLVDEDYWENVMKKEIGGDTSLLKLQEGVTWEDVVKRLWKEIKIDWFEVISDPYFYQMASYFHVNDVNVDIFKGSDTRSYTKILMSWKGLPNCEDHPLYRELFDNTSNIYVFNMDISSFKFLLPNKKVLKFIVSAEGLYFFLEDIDLGRIDGHASMPALRWEECKRIAKYQPINPPYTHDYYLVMISLLAFPTEEDFVEYRDMVGNAYLQTGLIQTEEDLNIWREALEPYTNWRYDEENGAWIHRSGRHNPLVAKEIHDILKLLPEA